MVAIASALDHGCHWAPGYLRERALDFRRASWWTRRGPPRTVGASAVIRAQPPDRHNPRYRKADPLLLRSRPHLEPVSVTRSVTQGVSGSTRAPMPESPFPCRTLALARNGSVWSSRGD